MYTRGTGSRWNLRRRACNQVQFRRKRNAPVRQSDTQGCLYALIAECQHADLSKFPINYTIQGIRGCARVRILVPQFYDSWYSVSTLKGLSETSAVTPVKSPVSIAALDIEAELAGNPQRSIETRNNPLPLPGLGVSLIVLVFRVQNSRLTTSNEIRIEQLALCRKKCALH